MQSPGSMVKTKRSPSSCSSTIEIITFGFWGREGGRGVKSRREFETVKKPTGKVNMGAASQSGVS